MQHEAPDRKEVRLTEEFETDAQRIVRRHLENENDVITDEDIRSVRIGVSPHLDESSEEKMEELTGNEEGEQVNTGNPNPGLDEQPVTSWDTIEK